MLLCCRMPFAIPGLFCKAANHSFTNLVLCSPSVSFRSLYVPIGLDSPVGPLSPENAEASAIKSSLDHIMLTYYRGTFQFSTLVSM